MHAPQVLLVLMFAGPAQAGESPRAVIERAIAAHGGQARLGAVRADKVKLKGTLHVGSASLPFTNDLTVQLPGQYKSVVTIDENGRSRTVVHILDQDRATVLLDDQPQPIAGVHLTQLKQTLQLDSAMRLVPLLSDPVFTLRSLPEVRYNGQGPGTGQQVITGVRVQGKSQRDLDLYFDKPSGLLVKSVHRLDGPGGKDVVQEAYYGDYREMGGFRRPGKVIVFRDGKKVMEAQLIDARRFDRIDPSEFTRP